MSTRRREFCSERRRERERGVKVAYGIDETESLVCLLPLRAVPTERGGGHENLALKMGLL